MNSTSTYVKLEEGQSPPSRYNSHSTKNKSGRRKACSRCICYFNILLFLVTLTLLLLIVYFYTVVTSPQPPKYTIEDLQFKAFNSLQFVVTVKADNPNARVGFIYGEDSSVNVVYDGVDVCWGKLPHFHQGPMNVTLIRVELTGKTEFGSGFKNSRMIPLLVMLTVPLRTVVGGYPLRDRIEGVC